MRTASSILPATYRARLPKRCWSWLRAGHHGFPAQLSQASTRSITLTHSAASVLCVSGKSWSGALDYPWEKWAVFLHPAQRAIVERDFSGPARVSGSAGTGKTIVALHRAVDLARSNPSARVLLTTFSETLANALRDRLRLLVSSEPQLAERVEVYAIDALGDRLFRLNLGAPSFASPAQLRTLIEEEAAKVGRQHVLDSLYADGVGAGC